MPYRESLGGVKISSELMNDLDELSRCMVKSQLHYILNWKSDFRGDLDSGFSLMHCAQLTIVHPSISIIPVSRSLEVNLGLSIA